MSDRSRHPATAIPGERLQDPRSVSAFRTVGLLVSAYLSVSVLALIAVIALRGHASMVNQAVWGRVIAVVISATVMLLVTRRASRGGRGAFRRLRFLSAAMVIAIAVIIALPGDFPLWLKIEQGLCGLLLIGVVAVVNGTHLRGVFAKH